MTKPDTYLLAGGGTGGHLTPGLAVAEELQAAIRDCRIVFVGSGRAIEKQMVQEAGYEHVELPVESMEMLRRNPLRFLWRNWQGYRRAKVLLHSEQPRAVVGLGGFASVPLVLAASRRGVPTLLLEQNAIPGRANRFLGRRASAVCLTYPQSEAAFSKLCRTIVTGNPVRREIAALCEPGGNREADGRESLLVLGGSQGASGLNEAVRQMIRDAPDRWRARRIVHQTGPADCARLRAHYDEARIDAVCEPFFGDMARRYREATLVVSRAGATTLAELACAGCPAALVPYPHAADDHQTGNAKHFQQAGAARIVLQRTEPDQTARELEECVEGSLANRRQLAEMRRAMRGLARPRAAHEVVEVLQSLVTARIN